jgi:hypothetical protein
MTRQFRAARRRRAPAGRLVTRRLAPELRHLAGHRTELSVERLAVLRSSLDTRRRESAAALEWSDVAVADDRVARDDAPDVPVRI